MFAWRCSFLFESLYFLFYSFKLQWHKCHRTLKQKFFQLTKQHFYTLKWLMGKVVYLLKNLTLLSPLKREEYILNQTMQMGSESHVLGDWRKGLSPVTLEWRSLRPSPEQKADSGNSGGDDITVSDDEYTLQTSTMPHERISTKEWKSLSLKFNDLA